MEKSEFCPRFELRVARLDSYFNTLTKIQKARRRRNKWLLLSKSTKICCNSTVKARQIVENVYKLMEEVCGHGDARKALSSYLSMRLALEDCVEKDCNECKHRFRCFTE
jgi:hypothetical protein